jgi:hypothetical protein
VLKVSNIFKDSIKLAAKKIAYSFFKARRSVSKSKPLLVRIYGEQNDYIIKGCDFHLSKMDFHLKKTNSPLISYIFSSNPVIVLGNPGVITSFFANWVAGIYYVDPKLNPKAAWRWNDLTNDYLTSVNSGASIKNVTSEMSGILKQGFNKAYVFGTGPSLELARHKDWSDGYRVVCNTIVKDKSLWDHISPHIIVAGDALYHFGFSDHAITFRADLMSRLRESPALFVFPAQFEKIVYTEFSDLDHLLVPIAIGESILVHKSVIKTNKLPNLGNALLLLLLPLGFSLSANLSLWGFDGRRKDDKLFWSNAANQSYPELIEKLNKEYPAFFNHHIPEHDKEKYIRSVHGDVLEHALFEAESDGCSINMLHSTTNEALSKRGINDSKGESA